MQQTTWEKEDRQPALQRFSPAQDQGEQRLAVNAFLTEHWGSTVMMVRGEQVDMSRLPGIFVEEQGQITALLTYCFCDIGKGKEAYSLLGIGSGNSSEAVKRIFNAAADNGIKNIKNINPYNGKHNAVCSGSHEKKNRYKEQRRRAEKYPGTKLAPF